MAGRARICYGGDMDWKDIGPFIAVLGVLGAMWWQLNSRIDAVNILLTENLITLNREIGELKGASHTHTQAPR